MMVKLDSIIIGGGIAGLWLLTCLRQKGFQTILLETETLGGGQTQMAQGIIHGGLKYTLQGLFTQSAQKLAEMPKLWKTCLAGQGEIDLSNVPILARQQFLWGSQQFTSRLIGLIAKTTLAGSMNMLKKKDYPSIFQHPRFKGSVYALDEIVIDVPALIARLAGLNSQAIFKIDSMHPRDLLLNQHGKLEALCIRAQRRKARLVAQQFIFAAGTGNDFFIKTLSLPAPHMQKRPLHMVLLTLPTPHILYGHALALRTTARPRLTISTHKTLAGKWIWYLGGLLAEEGITRSKEEQITIARQELATIFPYLDLEKAHFNTIMIDRAEPYQASGRMPENVYAEPIQENALMVWPIKLTLAPALAQKVCDYFDKREIIPNNKVQYSNTLEYWPRPSLATPIWDKMTWD